MELKPVYRPLPPLETNKFLTNDGTNLLWTNLVDWVAGTANQVTVTDDADGTITLSLPNAGDWDAAYTHSQIAGGDSVHVSTAENTNWDTAYTHSQDNSQAHSDYLLNNADDSTSGTLTAAGLTLSGLGTNNGVLYNVADVITDNANLTFDGNTVAITGATVGVGTAPLVVRNTNAYADPYTQYSQVWLDSAGVVMAYIRNDGSFDMGGSQGIMKPKSIASRSGSAANLHVYSHLRIFTDHELRFRDDQISISSIDDGHLDLGADVSIDLNSNVSIDSDSNKLLFGAGEDAGIWFDGNDLSFQNQNSSTPARYDFWTKDGDGTDDLVLGLFGVGTPADITPYEVMHLLWHTSAGTYDIRSYAGNGGTVRPLRIYTGSNTSQLVLNTNGTLGTILIAGYVAVESYILAQDGIYLAVTPTSESDHLDYASNGTGSNTKYIGNKTIDTSPISDSKAKINTRDTAFDISRVMALQVKDYEYKPEYMDDRNTFTGFIAEDVEKIFPQAVITGRRIKEAVIDKSDPNSEPVVISEAEHEEIKYVDKKELIPILWKAVQDLKKEIEIIKGNN